MAFLSPPLPLIGFASVFGNARAKAPFKFGRPKLHAGLLGLLTVAILCRTTGMILADGPSDNPGFVSQHCYDCHQGTNAEAGFDLAGLSDDLSDPANFDDWVKVYDRVAAGEMPPKDAAALKPAEVSGFLQTTQNWLGEAQALQYRSEGRVQGRRLTNLQLERTLQDLLGIDIPLEREMPEEPKTGNYKSLAALQSISHFHLEQHLKIVDLALDEAFRRALTPDDEWLKEMTAKQISRTRPRTREPEYIDGAAVVWSGNLIFYGRLPATTARTSGWYRFRFEVEALKKPDTHGVWCSVSSGQCVSSAPLMTWIDSFEATNDAKEVTVEAWLPAGHMLEIRPADTTLKKARFAGGQSANGEGGAQNVPGIKINWLNMERIHVGPSDLEVRAALFGDLPIRPSVDAKDASVEAAEPLEAGHRLIEGFAAKAFRRPVDAESLQRFASIFDEVFAAQTASSAASDSNSEIRNTAEASRAWISALRAAYRAILCSSRFLYFQEQPHRALAGSELDGRELEGRELDDFAIASRLSYFLWNSTPDETLLDLAKAGQLHEPETLKQQVTRMLATVRGQGFVRDFAREWLELSEIDFTEPDARLHRDFDRIVQYTMLDETHRFLETLLDGDQPIQSLIDSDFTFVNSRLARFYGMSGVEGDALRRVELSPEDHRGGLLAQGAILKVTANGTNTSPVLRGVWVSRRVLGQPIPPPPENVPAIEPDIRGAKTIREQLEKHRSQTECAACHNKIDPPGYALENFDAAGKWRENYPRVEGKGIKPGLKIDPSYVTADGQAFGGFEKFRELKSARPEPLARNFAEHLLVYGTGARIGFADRAAVDTIVESVRESDFGMRSILHAVVQSPVFLSK